MDIPDVELVVIYGLPDTMSQLYQVLVRTRVYLLTKQLFIWYSYVAGQAAMGVNHGLMC